MSNNSNFGQVSDVRFNTLSCKSRKIVDEDCNLSVKSATSRTLTVKENAVVCGDLEVKGNITGGSGGGSGGYQFSNNFGFGGLSTSPASSLNWRNELQPANGHLYTGPVNVPMNVTLIAGEDGTPMDPFTCTIVIQELDETELNTDMPGTVGNVTAMPFSGTGNTNVILTDTVTPTKSPAFWYYYCSGGTVTPSTTFIKSVYISE